MRIRPAPESSKNLVCQLLLDQNLPKHFTEKRNLKANIVNLPFIKVSLAVPPRSEFPPHAFPVSCFLFPVFFIIIFICLEVLHVHLAKELEDARDPQEVVAAVAEVGEARLPQPLVLMPRNPPCRWVREHKAVKVQHQSVRSAIEK